MSKQVVYVFHDGVWVPVVRGKIIPGSRSPNSMLNEGFWDKLGLAFTDPEEKFEFPIKPFEMDFTQDSKNAMYALGGLIALGLIGAALINKSKNT